VGCGLADRYPGGNTGNHLLIKVNDTAINRVLGVVFPAAAQGICGNSKGRAGAGWKRDDRRGGTKEGGRGGERIGDVIAWGMKAGK